MLFVEVITVQCEIMQNTWKHCGEKMQSLVLKQVVLVVTTEL